MQANFSVLQLGLGFAAGHITYSDATNAVCLSVWLLMTRNDGRILATNCIWLDTQILVVKTDKIKTSSWQDIFYNLLSMA